MSELNAGPEPSSFQFNIHSLLEFTIQSLEKQSSILDSTAHFALQKDDRILSYQKKKRVL
jgi:hypothetical protein